MAQEYDKCAKWLIQHHGDSVLRLFGIEHVESYRSLHPEQIALRRIPDGYLEVVRRGHDQRRYYLIEVATRPEDRVELQLSSGTMASYLEHGVLPEAVCLVLHPHGRQWVPEFLELHSPERWTRCRIDWRVLELWKLPADALLDTGDVGIVPWVPLADVGDSGMETIERCCRLIDERAPEQERESLLVATAILAGLRYDKDEMFRFFGDSRMVIESPWLKEIFERETREQRQKERQEGRQEGRQEERQQLVVRLLKKRFPDMPEATAEAVRSIHDDARLDELFDVAADCPDLESFQRKLA
ncbi:MAG: DUF4351 domain-containing protein [Planctomycetes bacterium]|nr:DUF4351 domain-containing protein [Planctomycetota bacterium]